MIQSAQKVIQSSMLKFEEELENADMALFTQFKQEGLVLVGVDGLSNDERREGETWSNELERQAEAGNGRARRELAELLSQGESDIAEEFVCEMFGYCGSTRTVSTPLNSS